MRGRACQKRVSFKRSESAPGKCGRGKGAEAALRGSYMQPPRSRAPSSGFWGCPPLAALPLDRTWVRIRKGRPCGLGFRDFMSQPRLPIPGAAEMRRGVSAGAVQAMGSSANLRRSRLSCPAPVLGSGRLQGEVKPQVCRPSPPPSTLGCCFPIHGQVFDGSVSFGWRAALVRSCRTCR